MTWGTVTCGPINLFTWNSLYPYNYATNYGGQYQFNVMPSYFTPAQAFGIQNIFNPFYNIAQMMNRVNSAFNPFQNMQQMMINQAAYANGYAIGENIGNNVIAQNLGGNISSLKSQLEQALTSDQLTVEQKDELRALRREVEALEDKFNELMELQKRGATPDQVRAGITMLNEQYRELRDRIQSKADEIRTELGAGSSETTTTTTGDGTVIPGGQVMSDKLGTLELVSFNQDMVAADVDDENVREIVNTIYSKVDGIGSGHIKKYLEENITKDNVVEVMLQWNKHYAEGYEKADPLGLTETLMDERLFGGHKICEVILTALEERLKDYQGVDVEVYNKANTQLAIARRENDAWWTNEDKMSNALNVAHKCITILMYEQAGAQNA